MSTSEGGGRGEAPRVESALREPRAAAAAAVPSTGAGYPDLTVLAQIANELFRALPGDPPSTPPSAPTWTPVSATPSPAGAGSAPAFAGAPSAVAPGISGAALPAIPGALSFPGITGVSLPVVGGTPSLPGTSGAALQGLTAPTSLPALSDARGGAGLFPGAGNIIAIPQLPLPYAPFAPPTWSPNAPTPSPASAGGVPAFGGAGSSVAPGISGAALPSVPGATSIPGVTGVSLPAVGATSSLPGTSGAALQGLTEPAGAHALTNAYGGASPFPFADDLITIPQLPSPYTPFASPAVAEAPGVEAAGTEAPGGLLYFLSHARTATPAAATPGPPATAAHTPGRSGAQEAGAPSLTTRAGAFDAASVRRDFPILEQRVHGDKPLIWLDNAATTQKPRAVIDRIAAFYEEDNSNIHRAAHALAARATDAYEGAREKVRRFLNAPRKEDIVFTRGATEAINLVAQSWGRRNIGPGDEIVISWLEHHSNIVPWQMLCADKGAKLRVAPVDDDGQVILEEYERLLSPRTRLVSITHVSNALGTVLPVEIMARAAHRHGARVLVDGAQAVSHMPVDVQALDCDFYVFSGHKVFGPTGIGALFGKSELLETAPPWQGGGNMIVDVTFEKTVYAAAPARFEAGTGNIADAVGLGAAIDYVQQIGMPTIARYEHDLLAYATDALQAIPGLRPIGTADEKAGVISFVLDGFRPEEVGSALDRDGIAVRSGHHCAQPALRRFGLEQSVRPSLALYNTCEDIDAMVASIRNLQRERGMR